MTRFPVRSALALAVVLAGALAIAAPPRAADAASFVLPVARGGTGAATLDGAGIVTKASAQTLTGRKTGQFTLAAGTATAGTSPIKFTTGTLLTTPEAGAVEFNSGKLYHTGNATRGRLFAALEGSATWDVASLADGAGETSSSITVTGAALGDFAVASMGVDAAGVTFTAYVDAADSVKIRAQNESGGIVDLASTTARVIVFDNAP